MSREVVRRSIPRTALWAIAVLSWPVAALCAVPDVGMIVAIVLVSVACATSAVASMRGHARDRGIDHLPGYIVFGRASAVFLLALVILTLVLSGGLVLWQSAV